MITGEALLQFCELRLDNIVYRLGLANSRSAARQLVSHKHITVNDKVVNIPSYSIKMGDVISVRQRSKSLESILDAMSSNNEIIEWLEWNVDVMKGKLINIPSRDQIPENIKEQLIVELYSK